MRWSDVVVAIPTVQERRHAFEELLDDVRRHCPGAALITITHDPDEPPRVDFPRLMTAAEKSGRPWVLQLEDDVALAPTFGRDALAIELDDVDLLSLFSRSSMDLEDLEQGRSIRRVGPKSFSMSQAFFLRSEFAAGIESFSERWYEQHPQHQRAADLLLGAYLSQHKARCFIRVPSLVQHRRLPSTLPGHRGARQSESFRKAFGEIT